MALSGEKPKAVGEATYNQNMFWLYIPIMLAMAIGPHLSWKKTSLKDIWLKIANPLAVALFMTGCLLIWSKWGFGGLPGRSSSNSDAYEWFRGQQGWMDRLCHFIRTVCPHFESLEDRGDASPAPSAVSAARWLTLGWRLQ